MKRLLIVAATTSAIILFGFQNCAEYEDTGAMSLGSKATATVALTKWPAKQSSGTSATFEFASTDGAASFVCSWNGSGYEPCSSPATRSSLASGPNVFAVASLSSSGKQSEAVSYSWVIDINAPSPVTITNSLAAFTREQSVQVQFTAPAGSTTECKVDQLAAVPCTSPFTASALAEGDHAIQVYAKTGGSTSSPVGVAFKVDITAPQLSVTGPPAQSSGGNPVFAAVFNFVHLDPGSGVKTLTCQLDAGAEENCLGMSSKTYQIQGNNALHSAVFKAVDNAGNVTMVTKMFRYAFIDPNPPPQGGDGN